MNQRGTKMLVSMLFALAGWSLTTQAISDTAAVNVEQMAAQNTDELQAIQPGEGCYGALRGYLDQPQTQFDDGELVPGGTVASAPVPMPAPAPAPASAPTPVSAPTGVLATDDAGSMNAAPAPTPVATPQQQAQVDALATNPSVQAIMNQHKNDNDDTALIAALIAAGIGAGLAALLAKKLWDSRQKSQIKISAPTGFRQVGTATQPEKLPTGIKPTAPAKPARPWVTSTATPEKLPTAGTEPAKPATAPWVSAQPTKTQPSGVQIGSQAVSSQAQKLEMIKAQQAQMATITTAQQPQRATFVPGQAQASQLASAGLNVQAQSQLDASVASAQKSTAALNAAAQAAQDTQKAPPAGGMQTPFGTITDEQLAQQKAALQPALARVERKKIKNKLTKK